jgi:hypothetical protein
MMVAILTGMRWHVNVVLIYISFMARDAEHFFEAIWTSFFEKALSVHLPISSLGQ